MTQKEIEERKSEIASKIDNASNTEELAELRSEIESLNKEVPEEVKEEISHEEERGLIADVEERKEETNLKKIEMEERKMEKFTTKSPEYKRAWAKSMLGLELDEVESRAVGDAITTTATTFVAADDSHNGINNGGLFIPEDLRLELLERASKESPIFRDIRKLTVDGNVDLPYLFAADDANWVAEGTDTVNEGQEYRNLTLTGHELAKDVVITWKAEAMTVDGFLTFIVDELYEKMYKAYVTAVIYGDGSNKPTGITNGLTAVTKQATTIDTIKATLASLSEDARIGAKAYVSAAVEDDLIFYKDSNNNYPYLIAGLTNTFAGTIEKDPFLSNHDIICGNMRNYVFNEVKPVTIERERSVKGRKVIYGAYAIADGKARPGYFAYGQDATTI